LKHFTQNWNDKVNVKYCFEYYMEELLGGKHGKKEKAKVDHPIGSDDNSHSLVLPEQCKETGTRHNV
jgi:hypothetical protein